MFFIITPYSNLFPEDPDLGNVRYIDEVPFDSERYARMLELDGSFIYITPRSAAYAEFYEHTVKKLRITIDVPEGHYSETKPYDALR